MKVEDFDFDLDESLIAQHPEDQRDHCRLMVMDRDTGETEDKHFYDLIDELRPGDLLVMNDSKVIPARLFGHREGKDEEIELVLLNRIEGDLWDCIVRPGRKMKEGTEIHFADDFSGLVEAIDDSGNRKVRLFYEGVFEEVLDKYGHMPTPPYIKEKLKNKDDYQTVYAREDGSAAAPTAGLHFTEDMLKKIRDKGVKETFLTLHIGLGTFRPMKVENIEDHHMHSEHYFLPKETADLINETKREGGRVVAVGTTAIRTLEASYKKMGGIEEDSGFTDIFIYPGFKFEVVDALITNFHLPKSTLIMLVSAFSSRENIMAAYEEAVKKSYRFFSFGDAMFIR